MRRVRAVIMAHDPTVTIPDGIPDFKTGTWVDAEAHASTALAK
jgi:hypothetical protein